MPKWAHDDVLDAKGDYLKANVDQMRVCTSAIFTTGDADYSKVTGSGALTGGISMSGTDFTLGDGTVSGRMVTVAEQASNTLTASGTAAYVVLLDDGNSTVLYVTTCDAIAVTSGNLVTVPAFTIEDSAPI